MAHATNCKWAAPLDFFIVFHLPAVQTGRARSHRSFHKASTAGMIQDLIGNWQHFATRPISAPQHFAKGSQPGPEAMPSACLSHGFGLDLGHCDKEFFAFLSKSLLRAFPFFVTWYKMATKKQVFFMPKSTRVNRLNTENQILKIRGTELRSVD